MPILFLILMLVLIWFGFYFLAGIITGIAPETAFFLFHDNGIATFIFTLSLFMGFPLILCVPIAIVAGFIFAETWYTPVLQYLIFEAMLAILSLIAMFVFGAGSEIVQSISKKKS